MRIPEAGRCLPCSSAIFDEGGRLARDENNEPLKKESSADFAKCRWHRIGVSRLCAINLPPSSGLRHGRSEARREMPTLLPMAVSSTARATPCSHRRCLAAPRRASLPARRVLGVRLYGYREVGRWIQHYGPKTTWTEKLRNVQDSAACQPASSATTRV
jgi:hypothetical protein